MRAVRRAALAGRQLEGRERVEGGPRFSTREMLPPANGGCNT
jgi:hypothetical protein